MMKSLTRGPIAVGLAVVLAFTIFGIALAALDFVPPTRNYPVTCTSPDWEVGKVIITNTNTNPNLTATGVFTCTDDGPEPNSWSGNWSAGAGQSAIRGCGTAYDLLTIDVYNETNDVPTSYITHTDYDNYCQSFFAPPPGDRTTY